MNAQDYRDQQFKLLPQGRAWSRDPDSVLGKLLLAIGDGAARIEARARQLLLEMDPRTADETIADWETQLGLPDTCTGALTDLDDRRAAAWQKLTGTAGQSVPFLVAAAARLGFTVSIEEFRPTYCDCDCDAPVYGEEWHVAWGVLAEEAGPSTVLECVLSRARPAHTTVFFEYEVA